MLKKSGSDIDKEHDKDKTEPIIFHYLNIFVHCIIQFVRTEYEVMHHSKVPRISENLFNNNDHFSNGIILM